MLARKPTLPKLTPVVGTPLPSMRPRARRMVPSPPRTRQRSTAAQLVVVDDAIAVGAVEAVLGAFVVGHHELEAEALGLGGEVAQSAVGGARQMMGEHGDAAQGLSHGRPRRPAARPRAGRRAPRRARRARRRDTRSTPRSPLARGVRNRTRRARPPRAARATTRRRSSTRRWTAGSRTTPPLPTCSRPASNCGLTSTRPR